MSEELISVIMSAYNEKIEWFEKSIRSILNQSYKNIELILIVDNPNNTDLIKLAKKYEKDDRRVRLIINKENRGLVYCLNKGLKISKGKYIARMDADDISNVERLMIQKRYFDNDDNIVLIGTQANFIDEYGTVLDKEDKVPTKYIIIKNLIRYRNVFYHPSIMFKREAVINIGGYRDIKYAEDYDLITRILMQGYKVENLEECLLSYRLRRNSISRTNVKIQLNSEKFIKKNYKNNDIKKDVSIYCCDKSISNFDKIRRKIDRIIYKFKFVR